LRPDVVHFHSYFSMGVELFKEVKNQFPEVPVLMTLHEYGAICRAHGQMVKEKTFKLCYGASPVECHVCQNPAPHPSRFKLREIYIKKAFESVDAFISPSRFLIERFVEWGIPRDKLTFIENGQAAASALPERSRPSGQLRNRFAYFGRITPYKGLSLLLDAFRDLDGGLGAVLDIYGDHSDLAQDRFNGEIQPRLERLGGKARFHGPYTQEKIPELMAATDWVVVPSIWWENSPLVIQEAFVHGRPVISSDIGGMAEKVRQGENGLNFKVGNSRDLTDTLTRAMTTQGLWDSLVSRIRPPVNLQDSTRTHLEAYLRLLKITRPLQQSPVPTLGISPLYE